MADITLIHLQAELRVVRVQLTCQHTKGLEAVYRIDVAVSSLTAVVKLYNKPLPHMPHHESMEMSRELTTWLRELEGDLEAFRTRVAPYLGSTPEQIVKVGVLMRPNAVEYSRLRTYQFLVEELPSNGQHLRGLFHFARCLNLKNFKPAYIKNQSQQQADEETAETAGTTTSAEIPRQPQPLFPDSTALSMPTLQSLGLESESDTDSIAEPNIEISLPDTDEEDAEAGAEVNAEEDTSAKLSEGDSQHSDVQAEETSYPIVETQPTLVATTLPEQQSCELGNSAHGSAELEKVNSRVDTPKTEVSQLLERYFSTKSTSVVSELPIPAPEMHGLYTTGGERARVLMQRTMNISESLLLPVPSAVVPESESSQSTLPVPFRLPKQTTTRPAVQWTFPEAEIMRWGASHDCDAQEADTATSTITTTTAVETPGELQSSTPQTSTLVVPPGELEDAAIATAFRTPSIPPQGPVITASLGLPAKLPRTGKMRMYNRFDIPIGRTGDRCTRVNNLILQQDRRRNPKGFQLLIPHGHYPLIRPARRDWRAVPGGHVRVPLFPGHDGGVIWPPIGWFSLTPDQRRDELLQLGQILDTAWYGLQECHNAIDIGERYYAFTLPYSVKPGDDDYTDQAYDQDRFQTVTRQQIRLHEVTARRLGLWQSLPLEMYADQAAQDSWDNQRMLQLPRPIREVLDQVPAYTFGWDNRNTACDEELL